MKRILVLTGDAKTLVYHRGELLRRFAEAGLEVVGGAAEKLPHVEQFLGELGGRYRALPIARSSLNPCDDVRMFTALCRWIRQERPDYFFAYTIKSVVYGCLAARMLGVNRVYALVPGLGYAFTPDGTWKQRAVYLMSRMLYSLSLRCCHGVFLQNHDDERLLRKLGVIPRRVPTYVTLGSGVKLDDFPFREPRSEAELEEAGVRFVLVTRLLRNKGVMEFLEAARAVREKWPKAEFILVGPGDPSPDGIQAEELQSWVEDGAIQYRGETRDVAAVLQEADVFVLPTYYREGVPRSILEALATGMPIVTTDSVGSRETILRVNSVDESGEARDIVSGSNGWLIPTRDVEALREVCEEILQQPVSVGEMSRESRRFAERVFDVRKVNERILEVMGLEASEEPGTESIKAA